MKCPNCGTRFDVNWQVYSGPGGQESPGTFLWCGVVLLLLAPVLHALGVLLEVNTLSIFGGIMVIGAFFSWSQIFIAWLDCRGTHCPECKHGVRVFPWSR